MAASVMFYRVRQRVHIEQLKAAMGDNYQKKPSEYVGTVQGNELLVNGQSYNMFGGARLRANKRVTVENVGRSSAAEMQSNDVPISAPSGVGPPGMPGWPDWD